MRVDISKLEALLIASVDMITVITQMDPPTCVAFCNIVIAYQMMHHIIIWQHQQPINQLQSQC